MTGPSNLAKGAAWMTAGTVVGTIMLIFIRFAGTEVHGFEIAFLRNLMAASVLLPWFLIRHRGRMPSDGFRWHFLRALFTAGAMLCLFAAIPLLAVAEFTALTLTQPFFATAGAALFLRERVPARRWGILVFGFAGGLLVAMPDFGAVLDGTRLLGVGLALLGTLFAVGDYLVLRVVARNLPSVSVVVWITVLLVPLTAAPAGMVWQMPSPVTLGWLAGLAAAATLGQYTATRAFYWTEVSAMMPFDFLRLVLAALAGWLVFEEPLTPITLIGAAMILLANLLVLRVRA